MDDDRCGRPVPKSKTGDVKFAKHHLNVDRRVTMHELLVKWVTGHYTGY